MSVTRTLQNQIAFHEYIEIQENTIGEIILDISKSTVHKIILSGDTFITLFYDKNKYTVPENSWINITLIVLQDEIGEHKLEYNDKIRWAMGVKPLISTTKDQPTFMTFVSMDAGKSWFGLTNGSYFVE